jgi:hypothetical protein
MQTLFAGADIRVNPALPDPSWDRERRARYLLRPDIVRPLSIDPMVWPNPAPASEKRPFPWEGVDEVRRWASAHCGPPDEWALLGLGMVAHDTHIREELARGGVLEEIVVPSDWRLLGYDVADGGSISGLCNCGYEEGELAPLRAVWSSRLNEHGLLSELADALSFRTSTDARVPEHAPFRVCGLWRIASSASTGPRETSGLGR